MKVLIFVADGAGLQDKLAALAAKRNLKDETVGPVITWTTKAMLCHVQTLSQLPGQRATCIDGALALVSLKASASMHAYFCR